jgi:hypothetical protein
METGDYRELFRLDVNSNGQFEGTVRLQDRMEKAFRLNVSTFFMRISIARSDALFQAPD